MKKRIVSVMLTLCMVCSMAACGNAKEQVKDSVATVEEQKVEIEAEVETEVETEAEAETEEPQESEQPKDTASYEEEMLSNDGIKE